jgi:hypothetical protein
VSDFWESKSWLSEPDDREQSGQFKMSELLGQFKMSELLALEEEPGRTCGHGGCKGPTIDKVKAANCPIGTEIRRCRADNKRKAAAAEAKKKAKTGGMSFQLGSFKPPTTGALDEVNWKRR